MITIKIVLEIAQPARRVEKNKIVLPISTDCVTIRPVAG